MSARQLTVTEAAELCDLYELARTVRGWTPLDAPSREASVRLSALIAGHVERGVPLGAVGRVLGASTSVVSQRLVRHGHKPVPPSLADAVYRNRLGGARGLRAGGAP